MLIFTLFATMSEVKKGHVRPLGRQIFWSNICLQTMPNLTSKACMNIYTSEEMVQRVRKVVFLTQKINFSYSSTIW